MDGWEVGQFLEHELFFPMALFRWGKIDEKHFKSHTPYLDTGKHLLDFPHGSSCTICPSPISFAWLVTQSRIPY